MHQEFSQNEKFHVETTQIIYAAEGQHQELIA
jgi:hypothetical protein